MTRAIREDFDAKSARTRQPLPLWAGAFDRATVEMPAEIVGAYILILIAMWEAKSCDLPAEDRFLARIVRTSPTIWRRKFAPALLPMLIEKNGRIFSEKLRENAEKTEEFCRKQHERNFRKSDPNPLKEKDTGEPVDATAEAATDKSAVNPKPITYNQKKEEEDARAREAISDSQEASPNLLPDTFDALIDALGIEPARKPRYWQGPAAVEHVARWKSVLGLTDADILVEAKASRARNPEPPDGPKALDRWMEQAAVARRPTPYGKTPQEVQKVAPKTPEERLAFFAEAINGPNYVPPSAFTPHICRAMLERKLVTPEKLREKGLTF